MNTTSKFSLKSFGYAFNGLREVSATQPNFKIHIFFTILVIAAGLFFNITVTAWAMLLFAIGLVTAAECFNTALEYLTNLVSPQHNTIAGKVKDLAAAAVLICSLVAFAIGLIVFVPKILLWLAS